MLAAVITLFIAASAISASPVGPRLDHDMGGGSVSSRWYRDSSEGHPVHKLFARQQSFLTFNSPNRKTKYPTGGLSPSQTPQTWTDALNKAVAAGLIPSNVPIATAAGYHDSLSPMGPIKEPICSRITECQSDGLTYETPAGIVALSFNDGPLPPSKALHAFCRKQKQKVTHFYIGSNILDHPDIFTEAYEVNGDDIAVRAWSYPHMTQLSNELVLAELGWTMQIIHDFTGGRLPRYWHPPYGESDRRVRAIATHVFGLQSIIWNRNQNAAMSQTRVGVVTKAYASPKSYGLNTLEHESTAEAVRSFIDAYPMIARNGWTAKSLSDALGTSWYLNSVDNPSAVTNRPIAGGSDNLMSIGGRLVAGPFDAQSGTSTGTSASSTTSQTSAKAGASSVVVHASFPRRSLISRAEGYEEEIIKLRGLLKADVVDEGDFYQAPFQADNFEPIMLIFWKKDFSSIMQTTIAGLKENETITVHGQLGGSNNGLLQVVDLETADKDMFVR